MLPFLRRPQFLFLELNTRCNLKCRHCVFWLNDDEDMPNYLSAARRTEILEELAELNPKATVVSCGGEPMLDLDPYFHVASEARRLGLGFFSVINGTGVADDAMADRMIAEGPSEITVSLDHHTAKVHDRARGLDGSFDAAVGALRRLVAARERAGSRKPIYAMTIVCERNYRDLEAMYAFVLGEVGADKLKLNILQPSFGLATGRDPHYAQNLVHDVDELVRIIERCDARFDLGINPVWLGQVAMYHRSMHAHAEELRKGWLGEAATSEHICNTYERNVMVDRYGMARLCFATQFSGKRLERKGDLKRFWKSMGRTRRKMRSCNRPCGISHSVRRVSATTGAGRPTAAR